MFRFLLPVTMLAVILGAAACGGNRENAAENRTDAEKREALRDSAFGELTGTLDKAQDVDAISQDRKNRLDDALAE